MHADWDRFRTRLAGHAAPEFLLAFSPFRLALALVFWGLDKRSESLA